MIIPKIICDYLDSPLKKSPFEATLIENFLCDDCYKLSCTHILPLPKRCLLSITDYEIHLSSHSLSITLKKASIKSINVQDHSAYLCFADHNTQVVQALQKSRHSQVVQRCSNEETQLSSLPEIAVPVTPIGFGVKSSEKSIRFAKQRATPKILQSQDDILSALATVPLKPVNLPEPSEELLDLPDFPDWALAYLLNKYKVVK